MKDPFSRGDPRIDWSKPNWLILIGACLLLLMRFIVSIVMWLAIAVSLVTFAWLAWLAVSAFVYYGSQSIIWVLGGYI